MRDRQLTKNLKRLEALIERWKVLSQFLDKGLQQNFTPEDEAAFLELKSAIAREYEQLMILLAGYADREERPLRLLNSVTSLATMRDLPEGVDKRIATEWHNAYIGWQALLGRLSGRQTQLATQHSLAIALRRVCGNPFLLLMLIALAAFGTWRLAEDALPRVFELWEQLENRQ